MRLSVTGWERSFLPVFLIAFLAAGFLTIAEDEKTAQGQETAEPAEPPAEAPGEPARHEPAPADSGVEAGTKLPFRVLGNFFFEFPGLETYTLTPMERDRFLQRVNQELCGCGSCSRDTVANCYINDPGCRFVRQQAKKILNEVRAGK